MLFSNCIHLIFVIVCAVNSSQSEYGFFSTEQVDCVAFHRQLTDCECYESKTREERKIFCNDRNLTSIPVNVTGLTRLKINNGKIQFIKEAIQYSDLRGLYLEENQIRFIEDRSFKYLSHLVDLSLANNEISDLSSKTFEGLTSLQLLVLSGNRLYVVRAEIFSGSNMPSLQILKLDECSLYIIEPNSFLGLSSLTILDIAKNHIEQLPAVGNRNYLSSLSHLNLSDNYLNEVEDSFFGMMPFLTHLYLDRNIIKQLHNRGFNDSLTFLSIRQNRLTSVGKNSLRSLRNLKFLDISYNLLTRLNFAELPDSLEKVLIHDNPWDCSECKTNWMIDSNAVSSWNTNANVSCASPNELSGVNVYQNRHKVFSLCESKSITVPLLISLSAFILLLAFSVVIIIKLRAKRQRKELATNEEMASLACSKMKLSSTSVALLRYDNIHEDPTVL